MRHYFIPITLASLLLLSACQDPCADCQRQLYLVKQQEKAYSMKQQAAKNNQPTQYEFCGDEITPCPKKTLIK